MQRLSHHQLQAASLHIRCNFRFSTHIAKNALAPGPVITFLSPSPRYSQSAVNLLHQLLNFPKLDLSASRLDGAVDQLDELYFGSNSLRWDSEACMCPSSGTVLHFLSLEGGKPKKDDDDTYTGHCLISIHGGTSTKTNTSSSSADVVMQSRKRLAEEIQNRQFFQSTPISFIESRIRGMLIRMMHQMGKQSSPSWLFAKIPYSSSYQPVHVNLSSFDDKTHSKDNHISNQKNEYIGYQLRELAVPFFAEISTLQRQLSQSSLSRPIAGLYQFEQPTSSSDAKEIQSQTSTNHGLILRPIPTASEDFRLPPPSLIFQCASLSEAKDLIENEMGGVTAKIGWRGDGQNGSLIVSHPSVQGLDIRLNEVANEWILNSYFDEAQEALLAASLDDLQSSHVMTEGSEGNDKDINRQVDPKNLNADCWVETRANVMNPLGFLSKRLSLKSKNKPAVAKPPDLPYE